MAQKAQTQTKKKMQLKERAQIKKNANNRRNMQGLGSSILAPIFQSFGLSDYPAAMSVASAEKRQLVIM